MGSNHGKKVKKSVDTVPLSLQVSRYRRSEIGRLCLPCQGKKGKFVNRKQGDLFLATQYNQNFSNTGRNYS